MRCLNKSLLEENVGRAAKYDFDDSKVFGSAYGVLQDGETVLKECFGVTSAGSSTRVTGKTLFRLASMSKPVTAVAVLVLVDRGLIKLTDPVSKFIPEFKGIHIKTLNEAKDAAPELVLEHMHRAVDGFVKEAEQFDDLTMLCLAYRGRPQT